jgi:multidrug efflux pump subunit AcrB
VETLPISPVSEITNLLVRDVARVREGSMVGQYNRLSSQRYLSITANVVGEDMGRAARQVAAAVAAAGEPPRGVNVFTRGQMKPMLEMFQALGIGLAIAVIVILVLLTAYFESPRLALVSVSAVPGVLSGVVTILLGTGTTLNIESFMGTIMCIGVSVSNSVMLVTFMAEHWRGGMPSYQAAVRGAAERLRPVLMTACAMTVGMVPMSLALEAGSQMQAPLGRAVIGGLVCSTFTTLLIVPAVFTLVIGRSVAGSPSVHPDDPESKHYDAPVDHAHEVMQAEPAFVPAPPHDLPDGSLTAVPVLASTEAGPEPPPDAPPGEALPPSPPATGGQDSEAGAE